MCVTRSALTSADRVAFITVRNTSFSSRKRISVLAGWTLTSINVGSISMWSTAKGKRR